MKSHTVGVDYSHKPSLHYGLNFHIQILWVDLTTHPPPGKYVMGSSEQGQLGLYGAREGYRAIG